MITFIFLQNHQIIALIIPEVFRAHLTEPLADGLGGEVSLVDHLCARVVQGHDGVRVGGNLGLESLVLLDLRLGMQHQAG